MFSCAECRVATMQRRIRAATCPQLRHAAGSPIRSRSVKPHPSTHVLVPRTSIQLTCRQSGREISGRGISGRCGLSELRTRYMVTVTGLTRGASRSRCLACSCRLSRMCTSTPLPLYCAVLDSLARHSPGDEQNPNRVYYRSISRRPRQSKALRVSPDPSELSFGQSAYAAEPDRDSEGGGRQQPLRRLRRARCVFLPCKSELSSARNPLR